MTQSGDYVVYLSGLTADCREDKIKEILLEHTGVDIAAVNVGRSETCVSLHNSEDANALKAQLPLVLMIGPGRIEATLKRSDEVTENDEQSSELTIERCSFHYEVEKVKTWGRLEQMPAVGRKGILVQGIPSDMKLDRFVTYFESQRESVTDRISHLFMLPDGVFIDMQSESTNELILNKPNHSIDGQVVLVMPKIVPGVFPDRFLLKACRDTATKYVKRDFERMKISVTHLEKISEVVGAFTFSTAGETGERAHDMRKKFDKQYGKGIFEVTPLRQTDCIIVDAKTEITEDLLNGFLSRTENCLKITKAITISEARSLVFCSNFADAEELLEKFRTNQLELEGLEVKISRYLPEIQNLHGEKENQWRTSSFCDETRSNLEHNTEIRPVLEPEIVPAVETGSDVVKISGVAPNLNPVKVKLRLEKYFEITVKDIKFFGTTATLVLSVADASKIRRQFPDEWVVDFGRQYYLRLCPGQGSEATLQQQSECVDNLQTLMTSEMCFSLEVVQTWYSHPPTTQECNRVGLLITNMNVDTAPEKIETYFREKLLAKGFQISKIVAMVDGIFITAERADNEAVYLEEVHEIEGHNLCVFQKIVPEFFSNRLLMKKTPKGMAEDLLILMLSNCAPVGTHKEPKSIKLLGLDASLVEYGDDVGLPDLSRIVKRAMADPDTQETHITLLPKTDCLKIKMVKGYNMRAAKLVFENKAITGGGKVTRFDQTSEKTGLLYFTSYKDVEAILSKFDGEIVKYKEHEFELEPYYHCFSSEHNRLFKSNSTESYYRKYLGDAAKKDIQYPISLDIYEFLQLKNTHVDALQSKVDGFANIELGNDAPCIAISPLLISTGNGDETHTSKNFENTSFVKVEKFTKKFSSRQETLDREKLEKVREMKADARIASNYDASDQENLVVRWNGNVVKVVGVKADVDSFIDFLTQLLDITNKSMKMEPEKYRWLMECKVFEEISLQHPTVQATPNDEVCQIAFNGKEEKITEMKCDLLVRTGSVRQRILSWKDTRSTFLVEASYPKSEVLAIFETGQIKAILDVKNNLPSLWADEKDLLKAEKALEEKLGIDTSISLPSEAHYEVTSMIEWEKLVRRKQAPGLLLVKVENKAVVVTGFRTSLVSAVSLLKKFLKTHVQLYELCRMEYIEACYIKQFHGKKLEDLPGLKWYLDHTMKGITLVGKKEVMEKAKPILTELQQKITVKSHCIKKHAIVDYFLKNQGDMMKSASTKNLCTILVESGRWPAQGEKPSCVNNSLLTDEFEFALDYLQISVIQSDILWDDSDATVRVHEIKPDGDHQQPGVIEIKSVAGLGKKFLHISISKTEEPNTSYLGNLLKEADKLKCKSISMPVLTAGHLSHRDAAEKMSIALCNFVERTPRTASLKHVRVITQSSIKFKEFANGFSADREGTLKRQRSSLGSFSRISDSTIGRGPLEEMTPASALPPPMHQASALDTCSLQLSVRQGDITKDKNDIIVNSIGHTFLLAQGGQVSKIIAEKGGRNIQTELSSSSNQELRVTTGGNLSCKKIIHVNASSDVQKLPTCIFNILKEAERLRHSSLSLPAIGTGQLGIPSRLAAREAVEAVRKFDRQHRPKYLKVVDFVIFQPKMVQDFQAQISVPHADNSTQSAASQSVPSSYQARPAASATMQLKVSVRHGSIVDESNDMIVNSLGNDFKLASAGAVSKMILQKGGQTIQTDLSAANGSLIRVTNAGSLKCKKILHLATPRDVAKLKDCVSECLKEAEKQRMTSISFPAIGTGGLGFPSHQAAEIMCDAVKKFSSTPTQYLKVIDFVVFQQNMVPDFQRHLSPQKASPVFVTQQPSHTQSQSGGPCRIGPLEVSVRQGDITNEGNDAIVISVGGNFDLKNGQVCKKVLDKAGPTIQTELTGQTGDKMRVTNAGGNLRCQKVIHLVTPGDTEKLRKVICQVLIEADKQGCSSISLPALGTGNIGLKSNDAAGAMVRGITKFAKKHTPQHLKTVGVVVFQSIMVPDFQTQLQNTVFPSSVPKRTGLISVKKRTWLKASKNQIQMTAGGEKTLVADSLHITIREGKINHQKTDVIVNNATSSFELSRGTIPRKSYGTQPQRSQIKAEISASTNRTLRLTSSGALRCKKIFHVAWSSERPEITFQKIFEEVTKGRWESISLEAPADGKLAPELVRTALEFVAKNMDRDDSLFVNIIATKPNTFKRLCDCIITQGKSIPGARIFDRPTADEVNLLLCCTSDDGSIEEAIRQIENKVKNSYEKVSIPCDDIATVKQRSWDEIEELQHVHRVKILVDNATSSFVIDGIREEVWQASSEIRGILSKISEAKNVMKLGLYKWLYLGIDNNWHEFKPIESKLLEELYQGDASQEDDIKEMYIDDEKHDFEINILEMKMTGFRDVVIKRTVEEEFPKHWSNMTSDYLKVDLKTTDPEYVKVKQAFEQTVTTSNILSISRIQNKLLYGVFERKKKVAEKTCKNSVTSRELFHGTSKADEICKHGFDRAYAGKNVGAKYGKGTYFAADASYSARSGYAKADANGVRTMILADVVTGDLFVGKEGMEVTPEKPWAPHVLYECLVDSTSNPKIFVVFHDASVYPSYVIEFK